MSKYRERRPPSGPAFLSWSRRRLVVTLSFISIAVVWKVVSTIAPHGLFQSTNVEGAGSIADSRPLSYHYQSRVDQMGWWQRQCEFCRSIIQPNQTAFPYLEIPPLLEEYEEQFNQPLKARIAVLHTWSSGESMAPPFFQYWLASAMANARIADFLLFVPDNATASLLRGLMPPPSSSQNIRLHVVGNLVEFFRSRIGTTLDEGNVNTTGIALSKFKPMLGFVFEDYIHEYSHWAWADMDMILGNLTKFLARPLAEGYDVISMSTVDQSKDNTWSSHVCSQYKVALAGQLTVFVNTGETRNLFRQSDLSKVRYRYDEGPFPALLLELGVRVAHVFAQVTDQFGYLDGALFDWSTQGLFKIGVEGGCYEYEVGLIHLMKGKRLIRPKMQFQAPKKRARIVVTTTSQSQERAFDSKALEQAIFPGPFVWETMFGFVLKFPVAASSPWQLRSGPSEISRECERKQ